MQSPGVLSIQAFWWAAVQPPWDGSKEREREKEWNSYATRASLSLALWKMGRAEACLDALLEAMPSDLAPHVRECDAEHREHGPRLDNVISDLFESRTLRVARNPFDLVLTERGFFGITDDLRDTETQNLVVVKLGCVEQLQLLRELEEGETKYYEYVDAVEIVHMGVPLEQLPGLGTGRLEIR